MNCIVHESKLNLFSYCAMSGINCMLLLQQHRIVDNKSKIECSISKTSNKLDTSDTCE